ncbi:cyanophycin synthetase [Roseateles toxinivorans]|uniref:Cyanophycin synthetase n=1 Tax=Roseateles toxinivorans TaxID=270368 RepID=A0A4V3CSS2_9BURK|nr:cyanophycin synthetase [Roseateles toxinivorans]TDP61838.1 cyanophycin synthetase [Roseateles toxinivorans]
MNRHDDIKLLRINYLRGPNVWTYRPVLEVWLDLGELEHFPSNLLPGFTERITTLLPALAEHHCGVGERGGFLQRLIEGTWSGHTLEHVVIELLNLAGMPTGFGQTRSTSQHGIYRMVFRARDEQVARTALEQGHALLMAAINGDSFDVPGAVAKVRDKVDDCYLGPSTACIVAAATDRRIPHIRLNDGNLVQLGHGARQRRIWTAETDLTSAIAEGIASEKDLTKSLLKACGVPVPEGIVVADKAAAWAAAEDIGLPVVVKPTDGNHGRGVTLDLRERTDIEAAFELAARHGSEVMVERYVRGHEHRLLVVGGKVVAAARGETAWVTGDGHSNVVELVDHQINNDPRRGTTEDFPLGRIYADSDGAVLLDLQRQGLKPTDIPAAGRQVLIQRNGNVAIDCTDEVHPEVAHVVSLAARVVGLDIAGVDVVAEDISKPLQQQGGAVVEVNAGPGLLMHLKPAEGMPRPVGRAIVDHLFPEAETGEKYGRIPIVGVAGSRGTHTIARLVAWLLHLSGPKVGLACRDGLFLDRRLLERGDCAHWEPGHRLLMNRAVEAAVFENGAKTILRDGLVYDRCQVGVVTDLARSADLAEFDVLEDDQMYKVMRTQVDVVLSYGATVLNVNDPLLVDMAELSDGEVIFYGLDGNDTTLQAHAAAGRRAVFLHQGRVALATGGNLETLDELGDITPWLAHTRADSADTLLAAIAAAWGMGLSADLITAGIETFDPDMQAPRGTQISPAKAH